MSAWLKRRFHNGIPLTLYVTGLVTSFCLLFALIAGYSSWRQNVEFSRAMVDRAFENAAESVKNGLENRLLPLLALVDLGATLENGPAGFNEKIRTITPFFIRSLDAYSSVLALNLGAANGDFFAAVAIRDQSVRRAYKAPEGTAYVLWRIESRPDGRRYDIREFRSPTYTLLDKRTVEATYDPRTRPWYQDAITADAQIMTEPYLFSAAAQVGVACSKISQDRGSVFSINILLSDVNDILASVPVSKHGLLLLLDKNARLLAESGSTFAWSKQFFVQPLGEHPDPRVKAVSKYLAGRRNAGGSPASVDGETFFSAADIRFGSRTLSLVLSAPYDDFFVLKPGAYYSSLAILAVLFCLLAVATLFFANRLSLSLGQLADEAGRGGEIDPFNTTPVSSPVREVRQLSKSITRLKLLLRERTGRLISLQDRLEQERREDPQPEEETSAAGKRPLPVFAGRVSSVWGGPAGAPGDPAEAGPASPLPPLRTGEAGGTAASEDVLSGARILLAESERVSRDVMTELLRGADVLVDVAEDGLEAVEKAWPGTYDLLILSADMPGLDGLTAARLLRLEKRFEDTPIVIVHGASRRDDGADNGPGEARDGIQDVLFKPVRPDVVRSVLRQWVQVRRGREEKQTGKAPSCIA